MRPLARADLRAVTRHTTWNGACSIRSMPTILVRDRMTTPAITERPDMSVTALAEVLRLRGISAVPVVDRNELVGIVSTTDLLRAPHIARIRDVMTSPVVTVSVDDPLEAAASRLADARVHRVVAMDGSHVAGVLSARDLLLEVKIRRIDRPLGSVTKIATTSIDLSRPLEEALRLLANARPHGLVVVDGDLPVGVFTSSEALAARSRAPHPQPARVEDAMSYEIVSLDVATPLYRAAAYAIATNVRRILVVEKQRLAGVVSCLDLVDVLARRE